MTPIQAQTVDFIRNYQAEHGGVSPTYDEVAIWLGIASKSGVNRILVELQERGKLMFRHGHARSIVLLDGPTREQLEHWSDDEVRRVALALHEISRERGLNRARVSA